MTLTGKIIVIGNLEFLTDHPENPSGLVILVPRDQLAVMKENFLYAKVKIELVKE